MATLWPIVKKTAWAKAHPTNYKLETRGQKICPPYALDSRLRGNDKSYLTLG